MFIPPEIRAETGWADEIPGVHGRAFRVGEVEGTWHGLESDGVVVHIHGRKGHRFGLSSTVHLVAGCMASRTCSRAWSGGESSAADVALSCWYRYSAADMRLCAV